MFKGHLHLKSECREGPLRLRVTGEIEKNPHLQTSFFLFFFFVIIISSHLQQILLPTIFQDYVFLSLIGIPFLALFVVLNNFVFMLLFLQIF